MSKNCWEVKACGREPGGIKVADLGQCPAATDKSFDQTNRGKNGGRICWQVAGTLCGGVKQGTFAEKKLSCLTCNFFTDVKNEEGSSFKMKKM